MYSANNIRVRLPDCVLFLGHLLQPQHVNSIHSLHFTWLLKQIPRLNSLAHQEWTAVWQALRSFIGIKELQVVMKSASSDRYHAVEHEGFLLADTMITRPRTFKLTLNWTGGSELPDLLCTISRMRNIHSEDIVLSLPNQLRSDSTTEVPAYTMTSNDVCTARTNSASWMMISES